MTHIKDQLTELIYWRIRRPLERWVAAILIFAIAALAGCSTMGLEKMSPEQMKEMQGLAGCTYVKSLLYGELGQLVVANDTVRKGATNQFKVSINPSAGCATVIEGNVGVAAEVAVTAAKALGVPASSMTCRKSPTDSSIVICEPRTP